MSEYLKSEPISQVERVRRQSANSQMESIAEGFQGSGLSSVELVREARMSLEDRVRRIVK